MDAFKMYKSETIRIVIAYEDAVYMNDRNAAQTQLAALGATISDWVEGELDVIKTMRKLISGKVYNRTPAQRQMVKHRRRREEDFMDIGVALHWMRFQHEGIPWSAFEDMPVEEFVARFRTQKRMAREPDEMTRWTLQILAHFLPIAVAFWRPIVTLSKKRPAESQEVDVESA